MKLIDADNLIDDCKRYLATLNPDRDGKECTRIHWLIGVLNNAPSAQPERKNGHWEMVPDPYGFFDEIPVCSECGCTTEMRKTYKFCPNCGADMRGGQNETD